MYCKVMLTIFNVVHCQQVPFLSPLEGVVYVDVSCHITETNVLERGFVVSVIFVISLIHNAVMQAFQVDKRQSQLV